MQHAEWIFDCDAPLDEFQRRLRVHLERRGWRTGPAQVYDFAGWGDGARAYVKVAYHDWGILVAAKIKRGLLPGRHDPARVLWSAARDAQLEVLGWRQGPPAQPAAQAPGPAAP